jgi:hypothetical protein
VFKGGMDPSRPQRRGWRGNDTVLTRFPAAVVGPFLGMFS